MIVTLTILIDGIYHKHYHDHDEHFWMHYRDRFVITDYHSLFQNSNMSLHTNMDYIIVYMILIISVWDSLFSWYRYYSTLFISVKFYHAPTQRVVKLFIVYGIPYCALFIAQIHFYYWLFPFVVLMHILFNTYCTWKFAQLLLNSYRQSIGYS